MRADAQENRQAILTAAWRRFSTEGIDVSMRTIASEAGVGIGTLYRHFPTKQDLILGLFEKGRELILSTIDRHAEGWEDLEQATVTWRSFVYSIAELRLGAIATQIIPTIIETLDLTAELLPRLNEVLEQLERVLHKARHWSLLKEDVDAIHFHFGLASITRPLPEPASDLVADFQPWLVDTYIDGLKPTSGAPSPD